MFIMNLYRNTGRSRCILVFLMLMISRHILGKRICNSGGYTLCIQ